MESLRWLLLGAGALLLGGIYALHLLQRRFPRLRGAAAGPQGGAATDAAAEVIRVNLKSRAGLIDGADLFRALKKHGLRYGEMGIFHRLDAAGKPRFSVANMVEPGNFEIDKLAHTQTPGLMLFLRLAQSASPLHDLDEMWTAAQHLARALNADILDQNLRPLSAQKQQNLRDEVLEYIRRAALRGKTRRD